MTILKDRTRFVSNGGDVSVDKSHQIDKDDDIDEDSAEGSNSEEEQ